MSMSKAWNTDAPTQSTTHNAIDLASTATPPDETVFKRPNFRFYYRQLYINGNPNDAILWAYEWNTLPLGAVVPSHDMESLREDYEPSNVLHLNWAKDDHPHFPFIPTNDCFSGPIFRRLAGSYNQFPIIANRGQFYLESSVAESWRRLELGLTNVANRLLTGFLFTLTSWRQSPSNYGYLRGHTTEKRARRCATQSREGFRELMGLCAYGIAMRGDEWREFLVKKDPRFHPAWLDELHETLCQITPIGAIVDISRCFVTRHIWKLQNKCPWWFLGALILPTNKLHIFEPESPHIQLTRPTTDQLVQFTREMRATELWIATQDLKELENDLWGDLPVESILRDDIVVPGLPLSIIPTSYPLLFASNIHDSLELCPYASSRGIDGNLRSQQDREPLFRPSPASPTPPSSTKPVGVHSPLTLPSRPATKTHTVEPRPGTGQRKGETWQDFFDRRDGRNARLLQRELREEKMTRERRMQNYDQGLMPPGMKVYEWVEVDGVLLREYVPSRYVRTLLSTYPPSQKKYDPYSNQIDLCTAFDPKTLNETLDEPSYHGGNGDDEVFLGGVSKNSLLSSEPLPETMLVEDLENVYEPSLVQTHCDAREFLVDISSRYGFTIPAMPISTPTPSLDWKVTRTILGHASGSHSGVGAYTQALIIVFISHLVDYGQSLRTPPGSMWDLSMTCHQRLDLLHANLTYHDVEFKITQPPPSLVASTALLYLIAPRQSQFNPGSQFVVAVPDPNTILQCLRMSWGPEPYDIVTQFVCQGSPFHLLREPDWSNVKPIHYTVKHGLGRRPQLFQPILLDYVIYEAKRDAVLTPAVTCAAIQKGGIIWRLVLEKFTSKAEIIDLLFQPSEHSLALFGLRFDGPDRTHVDYHLSDEDEKIICGVYQVSTGLTTFPIICVTEQPYADINGKGAVDRSWWPRSSSWDKGGMNIGYWTPDCEDWFQERLQKIKANAAKLRSNQEWKSALKMQKKGRALLSNSSDLAREFLSGRVFS